MLIGVKCGRTTFIVLFAVRLVLAEICFIFSVTKVCINLKTDIILEETFKLLRICLDAQKCQINIYEIKHYLIFVK